MAQVAFALRLPALSDEQEKRLHRYGYENCDETRIVQRDDGVVFGGILITPFKSKRVAQSSFTGYLKSWGIATLSYSQWYRELSLEEYFAEFASAPRVVGHGLQEIASGGMGGEGCEEPEPDTGAPAKRQRSEADLYVMAMSIDPEGEVCGFKVGRSGNIQQRVCTLSASMPFNIVVLATFPGAGGLENRVHKALEAFRNDSGPGREWFRTPLTHILDTVSAVMKRRGGSDD